MDLSLRIQHRIRLYKFQTGLIAIRKPVFLNPCHAAGALHHIFIGQLYGQGQFGIQGYKIIQVNTYAPFAKITGQGTSKLAGILKLKPDRLSTVNPLKISLFLYFIP